MVSPTTITLPFSIRYDAK